MSIDPRTWSTTLPPEATEAVIQLIGATLMACLRKVHGMASDGLALRSSALQKLAEFAALRYPPKLLWSACTTMGVATRDTIWFRVREKIPQAYA